MHPKLMKCHNRAGILTTFISYSLKVEGGQCVCAVTVEAVTRYNLALQNGCELCAADIQIGILQSLRAMHLNKRKG